MTKRRWPVSALATCLVLIAIGLVLPHADAADGNPSISSELAGLTNYLAVTPNAATPSLSAKAFALINARDGSLLVGNNAHEQLPIGSTTKMVTALVASQSIAPTTILTVPADAAAIEGSKVGLTAGEQMTFANMLQGLLIPSGNDIAYTLADHFSSTAADYQPFVDKMNAFVTSNHLQNTHFDDPAGLNDSGYSSAFDLAQIGRLVLNNSTLSRIVATPSATIAAVNGQSYNLTNTDQLLLQTSPEYNADVIGIKTGSTPTAGYCLVAAEKFHSQLVIGVVLGTPGNNEIASATQIQKLFTWANQNIQVVSY